MIVLEVCHAMELLLHQRTVCLDYPEKVILSYFGGGKLDDQFSNHVVIANYHPSICRLWMESTSLDSSTLLISAPKAQAAEYMNQHPTFSVLLQGTTDHTSQSKVVEVGYSGRNHHGYIFKQSALCTAVGADVFAP